MNYARFIWHKEPYCDRVLPFPAISSRSGTFGNLRGDWGLHYSADASDCRPLRKLLFYRGIRRWILRATGQLIYFLSLETRHRLWDLLTGAEARWSADGRLFVIYNHYALYGFYRDSPPNRPSPVVMTPLTREPSVSWLIPGAKSGTFNCQRKCPLINRDNLLGLYSRSYITLPLADCWQSYKLRFMSVPCLFIDRLSLILL